MDTKKLRQKILDLAIRGKLVPQDPNDEPASVLIEKIREEKERLIKEKKIKRDKNESHIYRSDKSYYEKFADGTVKCIDDEIPFEVPESWEILRFDDFCFLKAGQFVSAKDIYKECTQHLNPCYGGNGLRGYVKTHTHEGSFSLIGRQGALCGNVNFVSGRFHATEHAVVVQSFGSCINNKWLYYILSAMNLNQYSAGAAQPGLNVGFLNKLCIAIPPRVEQNRIVEKIESALAKVEVIDTDKEDLFQFVKITKSKILDLAIRGKLVPQDPNDEPASVLLGHIKSEYPESKKKAQKTRDNSHYTFEIPESWEWLPLSEFIVIISGVSYNKTDVCDDGIRVIRGGNITEGEIQILQDDVFLPQKYSNDDNIIKNGDIVIVASTGSSQLIGKPGFALKDYKNTHIGAFLRIIRPKTNEIAEYLKLIFKTDFYRDYIRDLAKGTSINNIRNNYIEEFEIPFPPLNEQTRIIQRVDSISSYLDEIIQSIET